MNKRHARRDWGLIAAYLIVIPLAIFYLLPFFWMVRSSFMNMKQLFKMPPEWIPKPWVWKNYADAVDALDFLVCFKNTIIVVLCGVSGTLITASMVAYAWSRIEWKGRKLWFSLSMSSMMLPGAVTLVPVFLGYRSSVLDDLE